MNEKKYYADIIVEYLKLKAAWLKEKTKLEEPFIVQGDLDAVYKFDDPKWVYNELLDNNCDSFHSQSCPHCINGFLLCEGCAYGENHGLCADDSDNTWGRFKEALGMRCYSIPTGDFLAKAKERVDMVVDNVQG